jgi:short-subunit dehydrogenase
MFHDKTVVITGASSGLGAVLAEAFADQGANLALFSRSEDRLEEIGARCRERGARCLAVAGDVARAEDCERLVDRTVSEYGGVDYLVANAGVGMWTRFEEVEDLEIFRKLMDTNYLGVVHSVFYALPHLKKSKGMIVAISSIQGKIGVPLHTGYGASKHAVQGFLASLRTELDGSGVDILTVLPHWLRGTNMRSNAFGKDGGLLGPDSKRHSKESISLEACSHAVITAVEKRKRELVIPFKLRLLLWLNLIHPGIVEWLVKRKVEIQEK